MGLRPPNTMKMARMNIQWVFLGLISEEKPGLKIETWATHLESGPSPGPRVRFPERSGGCSFL